MAVMQKARVSRILSFDDGFDSLPGIERPEVRASVQLGEPTLSADDFGGVRSLTTSHHVVDAGENRGAALQQQTSPTVLWETSPQRHLP